MCFLFSYGASQQRPCVRIGLTHAYLSHVKMTLANAKSVNRQTLENVVRNAASEFTRRTAIASLASLRSCPSTREEVALSREKHTLPEEMRVNGRQWRKNERNRNRVVFLLLGSPETSSKRRGGRKIIRFEFQPPLLLCRVLVLAL